MHRHPWGEYPHLPHIARQLQQDVDVSRRVLARRSTSADGSRGLQQTSHTGPDDGLPRRFVRRQGDTERQGMSVELPATLISRTGIAQRSSQVNWTMIMSSRGWQALHGLAEQPATLSTGIRHGPAVRAPGNSGSRQGGHAGQADRLLAPGFAPLLLPGRTVSVLLPTGRDPQHRAELRELPCRKPTPRGVYLPALQEVRGHFSRS